MTGCDLGERPPDRQVCNLGDCGSGFHWVTDPWEQVPSLVDLIPSFQIHGSSVLVMAHA